MLRNISIAAFIGLHIFAPPGALLAQSEIPTPARPAQLETQAQAEVANLDTLVARALAAHPAIRAASLRVDAARARVSPAGAWPDPMLMVGIQNLPVSRESSTAAPPSMSQGSTGADPMTMKMVGVGQTIPYPGKLSRQRRVAEREVVAAEASLEATRRRITREVKDDYYELAFLDRALEIVEGNQKILSGLIRVTEARYASGTGGQQDVLKARVEASRLAETAVTLTEDRRAKLAHLNSLLNQPSESPVARTAIPTVVVRAAVAQSANEIRFASAALGARAADSPLPALLELQELAIQGSAELREHEAMIAVQAARVEVARRDARPDFDLSLQYGQRSGYPDMVTASVSAPIPIFRRRKQDHLVTAAGSELSALEAEHHTRQNEIRADVARLVSDLERSRARLALYVKAVLPQSRASLASATASFQVGKVEFLSVLADQSTIFSYETEYFRALSDFARTVAELEQIVGTEILR